MCVIVYVKIEVCEHYVNSLNSQYPLHLHDDRFINNLEFYLSAAFDYF